MTRLTSNDLINTRTMCRDWDEFLRHWAGIGLIEIAARVSGKSLDAIMSAAGSRKVFAVPVTTGLGRIDTFSESVAAIIGTMGFDARVTDGCDVDGIYEACSRGGDMIFMADDNRYVGVNLRNGSVGENNIATSLGYVEVLDAAAEGLSGKDVLVTGYGTVGRGMSLALIAKGAGVYIYDSDMTRSAAAEGEGLRVIADMSRIKEFDLIADATNSGGWLTNELLSEDPIIVAPGVPVSLDLAAMDRHRGRFFHDPLDIGTAAMVGLAV